MNNKYNIGDQVTYYDIAASDSIKVEIIGFGKNHLGDCYKVKRLDSKKEELVCIECDWMFKQLEAK